MLASAAPLRAQNAGTVEFGAFGRYTKFDNALSFDARVGVGARLGVFLLRNFSLEVDGSYTPTYSQTSELVRAIPLHGRLIYSLPLGAHAAFCWAAATPTSCSAKNYRETESGAGGLLGLRLGTGDVLSIRLDATGDYIFRPRATRSSRPS